MLSRSLGACWLACRLSFRGARQKRVHARLTTRYAREPGIHNPGPWLWIPSSDASYLQDIFGYAFRRRGLPHHVRCGHRRLLFRISAQRSHDRGLCGRHADRGGGDLADIPGARRPSDAPSYAPWARNSFLFFGIFLATGVALGALLRKAVNETVGTRVGIADRLAGSTLGAVRIGLVAVVMVLIFDRLIPPDREPAFLRGSQLRPILSMGLKSLPPETTAFIDQLKKERRM
jgi:hypothetical protein